MSNSNMSNISGVIVGVVTSTEDPAGQGRVQVCFPWMGGKNDSTWASIATVMAGGSRGTWFMPECNDEVLVTFDRTQNDHPYIVGFLWNGVDKPPSNDPHLRLIHTVNGHEIAIFDPPVSGGDTGFVRISDKHGNLVELSNAQIHIKGVGVINIEAPTVLINNRPVAPVSKPI
jgi:uncharacterized protein involved in type VI secretion and phage assembly